MRLCVSSTPPNRLRRVSNPAIALPQRQPIALSPGLMRQEHGSCRSVLKDVTRGPAQKHLAQAAMGIRAHDQQAGFMLCPRSEQRIAHRAQFRCNHLRGRTDAMTVK